jgi:hypothetical protein
MKKTGAREKIRSSRRGRSLITVDCRGSRVDCNGSSSARDTRATTVPAASEFISHAIRVPLQRKTKTTKKAFANYSGFSRSCRAHSPQRIRFPLNHAKGQNRREGELRLERDMKMRCPFLIGILCGVMMAAAVAFALAIPANNNHWRVEIVNRGGAAWYLDKDGNLGWMWIAQPVPDRGQSGPHFVPRPRPSSDSSLDRL